MQTVLNLPISAWHCGGLPWDAVKRLLACERVSVNCGPDGGWRMADGGWRMADGGWRMADGGWRMADGGWRMADGGWRMADGGWRMADGGWRMRIIKCG